MALMKFKMIDEDLRGAVRRDSCNCPVARMITRTLGKMVFVGKGDVCIGINNRYHSLSFPNHVTDWITEFDRGQMVPILPEFEMEIPDGELS